MSRYELVVSFDEMRQEQERPRLAGEEQQAPQQQEAESTKRMAGGIGAVMLARNAIVWHMDIVGRNKGSTDIKQKIESISSLGGQLLSVGIAFGISPVMGAVATVGVALNYLKQMEQYNYEQRWERYALGEARLRAGASYNRSRV